MLAVRANVTTELLPNKRLNAFETLVHEGEENADMQVLNVAEKNDAARNIAKLLSRGKSRCREGFSKYNKIYTFNAHVPQLVDPHVECTMLMTSVSGHLMDYHFPDHLSEWNGCNIVELFDAPIVERINSKQPTNDMIKRTLEVESRKCQALIIWTNGDREGENIGFEIIRVCYGANRNLRILRAKFSEITHHSLSAAITNLIEPNENISLAVDVRKELDLRFGAVFTRFQTLLLQRATEESNLQDQSCEHRRDTNQTIISYGTCQFPTMGLVIERYLAILNFCPQPYWYITLTHAKDSKVASFQWERCRVFDEHVCLALYAKIMERPRARVTNITTELKTKWRPEPMCTTTLEKMAYNKLKLSAKETMAIAEKLYVAGYISYPKTDTTRFPHELDLDELVRQQVLNEDWGSFAQSILENGGPRPRAGQQTDHTHPPIYPTKYADRLRGKEAALYELITRHFLACVSQNAKGMETVVNININGECFTTNSLLIVERNYLQVYYKYTKWNEKQLPAYLMNDEFVPETIMMKDSHTCQPELLNEAQLISLMERRGIGTDATHAEHIETIQARNYVKKLANSKRFCPTKLGLTLYDGYHSMQIAQLIEPELRRRFEQDLDNISRERCDPRDVARNYIEEYKRIYTIVERDQDKLARALVSHNNIPEPEIKLRNIKVRRTDS